MDVNPAGRIQQTNFLGRLHVAPSPVHGQGVFASTLIRAGSVIEVSPVLIVPRHQVSSVVGTSLFRYCFAWPPEGLCLPLGLGSLYNHSWSASSSVAFDAGQQVIVFSAARTIHADEEVTINYNGDPNDKTPVWLDSRTVLVPDQ